MPHLTPVRRSAIFAILSLALTALMPNISLAASAEEIDIRVDATLDRFKHEVPGGERFLQKAAGILVFPRVLKAGFGLGGEYGEGALRIGGKTVDYYSTAGVSVGFQLGAQSKSIVLVFLTRQALEDFRKNAAWKAGVDGSVAVIQWGAGEDVNTVDIKAPIVGFVFSNKGLMFNLTLEGAKFTKLVR